MNSCEGEIGSGRFTLKIKLDADDVNEIDFTDDVVIHAPAYTLPLLTDNVLSSLAKSFLNSLTINQVK